MMLETIGWCALVTFGCVSLQASGVMACDAQRDSVLLR